MYTGCKYIKELCVGLLFPETGHILTLCINESNSILRQIDADDYRIGIRYRPDQSQAFLELRLLLFLLGQLLICNIVKRSNQNWSAVLIQRFFYNTGCP